MYHIESKIKTFEKNNKRVSVKKKIIYILGNL